MQPERDALPQMSGGELRVRAEVPAPRAQRGIAPERVGDPGDEADQLRDHCGDRRAHRTHAQRDEEQQVEADVEHGGEQQEDERRERVAQRAQDTADQVVADLREDAEEDHEAIGVGRAVNLAVRLGDVQEREQLRQQRRRNGSQQGGDADRQLDLRHKGAAQAVLVAAADAARRDDAEARRAAEGELQKDERERERVVDARHLLGGEHLPADDGVGQRVDLLQIIGKNDRRGVEQDNAPGCAAREIDRV